LIVGEDHFEAPPETVPTPGTSSDAGAKPSEEGLSKEVIKSAYNAFKKRWKLTRLDQESRIGRGPMSSGQRSTIVGIQPPNQFPSEVWEALVKQGRLKNAGNGQYAMP
jgi:hypothetical protein